MIDTSLAALSIERRTAALALFTNCRIDEINIRHLPAELSKASHSLVGFLNSAMDLRHIQFIAIAQPLPASSLRTQMLHRTAIDAIRAAGIPLLEVPDEQLFASYAHPPLQRREQLRRIARSIWPSLNNARATHSAQDAALLGLHTQVERLFAFCEAAQ
jgi:hypothetical protein